MLPGSALDESSSPFHPSVHLATSLGRGRWAGPSAPGRVLLLVEDLAGGTGNHVSRMLEQWNASGWHVTLVCQTPPLVQEPPAGVDVRILVPARWYDRFPLSQMRRFREILRIARALQPDVVHTYFFWPTIFGRLLKLIGVAPMLVENREDLGFSWGRGTYAALRLTRAMPDRIICVADAVRRVVLEREGLDSRRTMVIRNGIGSAPTVATDRPAMRRALGFQEEHVVVGMVANLPRAVKGGKRLLDMVGSIVDAAPSVRFLLLGLGTDPAALDPELDARGIRDYVVGLGYRTDVDACYAAMDISVLTSSTEGLSITLLESMRQGLPTVVTRVGGNPEAVVEGVTGFLVPVDEPGAFVERIVRLARDPELRSRLGDAGKRRVTEQFGMPEVARRYLTVYEELLEARGPRRRALSSHSSQLEMNT